MGRPGKHACFWCSVYVRLVCGITVLTIATCPPDCDKHSYDISSLKVLWLAGERSDLNTLTWAREKLNVPVIDHYWQARRWPPLPTASRASGGLTGTSSPRGMPTTAWSHGGPTHATPSSSWTACRQRAAPPFCTILQASAPSGPGHLGPR